MPDADPELFDKIVNLSKRRGFVFPSAEIYGGFRSTYDYGPVGVLLLRNVKDAWWRSMVQLRDDVVGLDAAILSPPAIWEASGHLANFTDPLVDCRNCRSALPPGQARGPRACARTAGREGSFTEARQFNLMFKTHAGPVEDAGAVAYLRPETAQGMFVNFTNVLQTPAARSRRSASPRSASRSATRSRRGTSCSAPVSSSRWRWSSSCPPDEGPTVVRVLVRGAATAGTSSSASPRTGCGCGPTTPTS